MMHTIQAGTARSRLPLGVAVVICGLTLRAFGRSLGLPAFIVKYGGSLLWATMVFLLVAILMRRLRPWQSAAAAMVIAVAVELFRLYHASWLDAFRLTLPGALLLGRIFSAWNIVAYAIGILLGLLLDDGIARHRLRRER